MFRGRSWGRVIALVIQVVLAAVLVASHQFASTNYVYPHYVFLILFHPFLVKRTIGLRLPPWQIVYISIALVLHPLGGHHRWYATVWWFDHLTHTLSATLVAAIGYTLIRAYVLRRGDIRFLVPAGTFIVAMTGGIVWEVVEMHVDWLTVYSYNDTPRDYVFNTLGAVLVVVTGRWTLDAGAKQVADTFGRGPGPGDGGDTTTATH